MIESAEFARVICALLDGYDDEMEEAKHSSIWFRIVKQMV